MEQNLNIAEILKNKPIDLKLYSSTFGYIKFNGVYKDKVYFSSEDTNIHSVKPNGKLYDDGECIIFPSKEMRDWSKFAWKKGDVLTNSSGFKVFFDKWVNEDYTKFLGKIKVLGDSHYYYYDTAYYILASKKEALEFIKSVEEINNGKPNLEISKIEKTQPEFKDGDIVALVVRKCTHIAIFQSRQGAYIGFHAVLCQNDELLLEEPFREDVGDIELRLATDSEKQQLFEALAKESKQWDVDKKQIVDLKPKYEFKPMDLCLMKYIGQYNNRGWELCQYAYTEHRVSSSGEQRDFYHAVGGEIYAECIPYKGNEHLLGTKKSK